MTFPDFVESEFHRMATEYRWYLSIIVAEARIYCDQALCEQRHMDAVIDVMRRQVIPVIRKPPFEITASDRQWYASCRKPDWNGVLNEYIEQVQNIIKIK